jgi:hypothetical protein
MLHAAIAALIVISSKIGHVASIGKDCERRKNAGGDEFAGEEK